MGTEPDARALRLGATGEVRAVMEHGYEDGGENAPLRRVWRRRELPLPRCAWVVGWARRQEGIVKTGYVGGDYYEPPEPGYAYLDVTNRLTLVRVRFWPWQKEELARIEDVTVNGGKPEAPQTYAARVWLATHPRKGDGDER